MATTRKRTIPRVPSLDPDVVVASVAEYLQNRSMRERSEYHEGKLKKELLALLDAAGEEVAKNKKVIELAAPLNHVHYKDGKPIEKTIVGIERRVRESKTLDEDRTIALLKAKGLFEQCIIRTFVIDEDAVLAANYDGSITDKELDALYGEPTKTPAFYITEGTPS